MCKFRLCSVRTSTYRWLQCVLCRSTYRKLMVPPPPAIVADLWDLHCAALVGIGPADAIVREVAAMFLEAVAKLPLVSPDPPLTAHRFTLRLKDSSTAGPPPTTTKRPPW
jgi:hypothetical protein